jgi:phosphate transport system protein
MNKLDLNHHISETFNAELEELRTKVLAMGGLVEQQISDALEALDSLDADLGENVVYTDHKVNAMEVKIDEQCTWIIARRQPTASDLRLLMTIIKVITDLERIGDEAEKIGHMATMLAEIKTSAAYRQQDEIQYLGQEVRQMLHETLDTFARLDSKDAARIAHRDDKIDRLYDSIIRKIMTYMMEDPRTITVSMNIIWVARALERIGDHTKNICEYIIYLVEGRDVRHTVFADEPDASGEDEDGK